MNVKQVEETMSITRRSFVASLGASVALASAARAQVWEPQLGYPDPRIRVLSNPGLRVFNSRVEQIATGFWWAEGPVWFGDGRYLLFSDIPRNRIMRWDEITGEVTTFREGSNN